jgi:alkanesulfonate monooxygenase SsuD/methylene tetrahydromethanopterin reductase-like flavin-dependent oxidoreductase (luciferase family)
MAELLLGLKVDPRVVGTYGGPELGPGESVDALEEAVQVIGGIWDPERRTVSIEGRHYRLPGTRPGPPPRPRSRCGSGPPGRGCWAA